jgi:hypothetical protein
VQDSRCREQGYVYKNVDMSYTNLDIYNLSFELFIETHRLSFRLPKYELYELGSQLRHDLETCNLNLAPK